MRRILIECGVAETRAALIIGDDVVRLWFGPARGDEKLRADLQKGDIFIGRVRSVSKPLAGAFVDIGAERDGFLPSGKDTPPHEGAAIAVVVKRPPIGAKGAVLQSAKHAVPPDAPVPSRLGAPLDSVAQAVRALGPADEVLVDRSDAIAVFRAAMKGVGDTGIQENVFRDFEVDAVLDAALDRVVWLDGGARMTFDETEGPTVVDVDAGAAAEGATGRLNDKVNTAASARLFLELSRRGIGGRIIVDFLPPSGAPARTQLMEQLRAARRGLYDCRLGRLSADGLFDLTAPREAQSLLGLATESAGEHLVRAGRRFTADWQAKAAIRGLERALGANRMARLALLAGSELSNYLSQRSDWQSRLADRHGARFTIQHAAKLEDRRFEIQ